jgi:hypothetical protein
LRDVDGDVDGLEQRLYVVAAPTAVLRGR